MKANRIQLDRIKNPEAYENMSYLATEANTKVTLEMALNDLINAFRASIESFGVYKILNWLSKKIK